MFVNNSQVQQARIIRGDGKNAPEYFNGGCYLTIGTIIDLDTLGKIDKYILPPQGMVYAISRESLAIPDNVIGYTTVKNSMSNKGLLSLNIGIVDACYNKPIGSVIINFGTSKQTISQGDQFLRMTFHNVDGNTINELGTSDDEIDKLRNTYISDAITKLGSLGPKFLSVDEIEKELSRKTEENVRTITEKTEKTIKDDIDRSIRLSFTIISAFGVLIAFFVNFDKMYDKIFDKSKINSTQQINYEELDGQIRQIKTRLQNLERQNRTTNNGQISNPESTTIRP